MLARRVALLRTLNRIGWRRVFLVARHRRRKRSGFYETACPLKDWPADPVPLRTPFKVPQAFDQTPLEDAERIVSGELRYFSWKWLPRPSNWHVNPLTGHESPAMHWSRMGEFDAAHGDVKWTWEASRLDWASTLARAYAATQQARYAEAFSTLLEGWRTQNPPNLGVNWFCAQECSLRMMALLHAAAAFGPTPAIAGTVQALAERIEPTIGYGVGQHNNHGISEAAALFLAGVCLPDHPRSEVWRDSGHALLSSLICEQFANDGSYVQHSFIYHRVAMRCALLAFLAAREFGHRFPHEVEARVLNGARFLRSLMANPDTGRLPNYGANDGANPLSLSSTDYLDFRPIVQLAYALLPGERAFPPGHWDEELGWFGIEPQKLAEAPREPEAAVRADDGGYYALRGGRLYAFIRVPKYTDGRPSQADALHLDVWLDGQPAAIDSGTYSYNDSEGWWKHFRGTEAHNTVVVDGNDQMPTASRFLFTDWTKTEVHFGRLDTPDADGTAMREYSTPYGTTFVADGPSVCGVSYAYRQSGLGVIHERIVSLGLELVTVTDNLHCRVPRTIAVRWHLAGSWVPTDRGAKRASDGLQITILRGMGEPLTVALENPGPPQGTASEHYGELTPITLVTATFVGNGHESVSTTFGGQWAR